MRQQAWQQFTQQGLPTLRDEQWKYTPLRMVAALLKEEENNVGGILNEARTKQSNIELQFEANSYVKQVDFDNVAIFNHTFNLAEHPLAVLNTALMQSGVAITIPDNTVIAEPIVITCIANDASAEQTQQLRHIIKIGVNSKAQVIFKYESATEKRYFVNIVQEIHAGENSHLEHVIIQEQHDDALHIEGVHIKQAANSIVKSYALSKGAKLARFDIQAHFAAAGSSCEMIGLYQAKGKQHVDFHLNAEHKQPHCRTKQFYRGIVDDKAKAVFNARVVIHPQADKSVSEQTNNNLLLSNTAEVDTKPELEVYHDDVKAAHGATVGQLDKDALFYLTARGIQKEKAEEMLRTAFLSAVIDEIDSVMVQALFRTALGMMEDKNGR